MMQSWGLRANRVHDVIQAGARKGRPYVLRLRPAYCAGLGSGCGTFCYRKDANHAARRAVTPRIFGRQRAQNSRLF